MTTELALTPEASAASATAAIKAEVRTIVVSGPDLQALLNDVSADMEIVPLTDVDSDEMELELRGMLGRLATVSSAIEAERVARKAPLLEASRWLDGGYNPAKASVDAVIGQGKAKLLVYAQAKAEAARKAEAEAAEKRRAEAAEAAKAEAEAIAAAQASAVEAAQLREKGSEQVAQAMESQAMAQVDVARQNAAVAAAAVHTGPVSTAAAPKGVRESWRAECTDKAKLLQHIGERIAAGDRSLIDLVVIDPKAINALGKLQKQHLNVPGLRPYQEGAVTIRKTEVKTTVAA
jgi:PIN domain nuclease of toxin-antitoxin system